MRHAMNLFLLACVIRPSPDYLDMFAHLESINHDLGQIQEALVINDTKGIQPYAEADVVLQESTKRTLTDTVFALGFGS